MPASMNSLAPFFEDMTDQMHVEMVNSMSNSVFGRLTGKTLPSPTISGMSPDKWLAWRRAERQLDREVGPRLGPGRAEYRAVMAPTWKRERILHNIECTMPGKTRGVFVPARKAA